LEKAETYLDLYKYTQEGEGALKIGDPTEVFYRQCHIAFETDEIPVFRMWDLFENIGLWSSDMPHLDGSEGWEAIANMTKAGVPQSVQEKMLCTNAAKLYGIEPELFVTEAPKEYQPIKMPRFATAR
jgi:hypothetical protein